MTLHFHGVYDILRHLLYCVNFTLWNNVRSHYMWSISYGLYGCSFKCSAQNLRFVENWFYALFRCNRTSKPLLISKPSLTIALKILITIEKPLIPMVRPSKNIQWWWCNIVKTIEVNGGLKKTLTIPSNGSMIPLSVSEISTLDGFCDEQHVQQQECGNNSSSWIY